MFLSIVIPTYNRNQVLCRTINSVFQEIDTVLDLGVKVELIIVDQTEKHDQDTIVFLRQLIDTGKIKYFFSNEASLPNARNIGIKKSIGDIICFIDDDVLLQPGYLSAVVNRYSDETVYAVVGRIFLANSTGENVLLQNQSSLKRILKRFLLYGLSLGKSNSIITKFGLVLADYSCIAPCRVDAGMGCNMSFRRCVFETVGLFDCKYVGNALREESDLFCRMKKHGLEVFYEPKMFLYHVMSNTGGCRSNSTTYWDIYFYNQCYFYVKNFNSSWIKIAVMLVFDVVSCQKVGIQAIDIIKNYSSVFRENRY